MCTWSANEAHGVYRLGVAPTAALSVASTGTTANKGARMGAPVGVRAGAPTHGRPRRSLGERNSQQGRPDGHGHPLPSPA